MSAETVTTTAPASGASTKSPKSSENDASTTDSQKPKSDSSSKPTGSTSLKRETAADVEPAKPLAPPPRPAAAGNNTPDYFASAGGGSLSLEPNPFEQSFGGAPPETPGGTKLPSVAALTSPSSLIPGSGATPFNWGAGSLRTGPLSPAMLSGPANDYFGDTHHLRGGFPTPNESSLRTGLTPGGSGSMFPAPSPNSSALFAQLAGGGATPGTLDFHRTALSAAAAKAHQAQAQPQPPAPPAPPVTSQPQELPAGPAFKSETSKPTTGAYDPHDNDAANGLFLLAQGRNGTQPQGTFPAPPVAQQVSQQQPVHAHPPPSMAPSSNQTGQPHPGTETSPRMRAVNGSSAAGHASGSDRASVGSDESEHVRPTSNKGKAKKNSVVSTATTNGRRKAQDTVASKAPPAKKAKTNGSAAVHAPTSPDSEMDDVDDDVHDDGKDDHDGSGRSKMTEEEKRRNFLERNRVAALKCRQRKKQWLANLQSKVETYQAENDSLNAQVAGLRDEVVNLKTLLLAHKDCPVTQTQGLHGAFIPPTAMEQHFNPQMNPYAMAGAIQNPPVMNGQPLNGQPINGQPINGQAMNGQPPINPHGSQRRYS